MKSKKTPTLEGFAALPKTAKEAAYKIARQRTSGQLTAKALWTAYDEYMAQSCAISIPRWKNGRGPSLHSV
jgi:hypothetical protein